MSWRFLATAALASSVFSGCSPAAGDRPPAAPHVQAPAPVPAAKTAVKAAPAAAKNQPKSIPDPATPDALVERAEAVSARGDLDEAIRLLQKALTVQPNHRRALYLLARLSHIRGYEMDMAVRSRLYIQSAEAIRKLRDAYPDLSPQERELVPPLIYDEACSFALEGQPEKALGRLAEAIDAGLEDPEMVIADPDFASLRKLPRFTELIRKLEQNDRQRATRDARALLAANTPFPFRFALTGLDGKRMALDDLTGNVIMVVLWGTWSPPCRKEIPVLKQLLAKYQDRGLKIVGINYERGPASSAPAMVKQFLAAQGVPYPCLIGDDTTLKQIPEFGGYPSILFLDRSRRVHARVDGFHSLTALEAIIVQMLAQSSPAPEARR
jgi:thiol-disulfide isomerase/thioredoxin